MKTYAREIQITFECPECDDKHTTANIVHEVYTERAGCECCSDVIQYDHTCPVTGNLVAVRL